ncbi:hypothetical protein GJ496_008994 [Pomphorhynchus laevis]|nr:hypothetical protein GJ496_008994 [Pomphorhynchus laevis]
MVTSTLPFAISGAGEVAKMAENGNCNSRRDEKRETKKQVHGIYMKNISLKKMWLTKQLCTTVRVSIKTNKNNRKNIASNTIASSLPYTA